MPRMRTLALLIGSMALFAGLAHADSLPNCPPGTHMVANPVPEGAMHHGGAHCDPDQPAQELPPPPPPSPESQPAPPPPPPATAPQSSGGCSVITIASAPVSLVIAIAALAFFARRRRPRDL
jgi:hypothetical protein